MSKYILFVSYQPLNKCWGVQYRKGNINHNEVNESLLIAFAEMAKFIETEKREEIESERFNEEFAIHDAISKLQ